MLTYWNLLIPFRRRAGRRPPKPEPGLPRFAFQSWPRHAHAGELGFRDFSSLFLVRENRRQPGNPACCIFTHCGVRLRVTRTWENTPATSPTEGEIGQLAYYLYGVCS